MLRSSGILHLALVLPVCHTKSHGSPANSKSYVSFLWPDLPAWTNMAAHTDYIFNAFSGTNLSEISLFFYGSKSQLVGVMAWCLPRHHLNQLWWKILHHWDVTMGQYVNDNMPFLRLHWIECQQIPFRTTTDLLFIYFSAASQIPAWRSSLDSAYVVIMIHTKSDGSIN